MAFDPVTAGLDLVKEVGGKLVDHFFPNAEAAAAAKLKLVELEQTGELARMTAESKWAEGQMAINLQDAKSEHWWQFGWRPAIGWVCVAILGLTYIPKALVLTGFWAYQCYLLFAHPEVKLPAMPPFPDLGITDVLGILGTLLGSAYLGKLRTDEKLAK